MSSRRPIRPGIHAGRAPEGATEGLSPDALREAFSRWASGVTVVAVRDEPHVLAITATAFAPVSIEPPLVLVCVGANAVVLPLLEPGARFAISILSERQRRLASMFADPAPLGREHFAAEGEPLVRGALVGLACTVRDVHPGGDHAIVVAQITRLVMGDEAPPLLYYAREYRTLA
ncbi:MAG TPA: flavin reductase family protein [Longimicrobiales bacterium]